MLAISFGVYNKIIDSILSPLKNKKFIMEFIPGFIVALVFGSNIIFYLLSKHYFITMMFFIGLISGGLPDIVSKAYSKRNNLKHYVITLCTFSITILLVFINNKSQTNNINFFTTIFIGFIESLTAIIPGISGTAILMILGYYDNVMSFLNNLFSLNMIKHNFTFGFPYILGLSLGILSVSKVVKYMLKNHEKKSYSIIAGLAFGSMFLMIKNTFISDIQNYMYFIGISILLLGYIISSKFNK